MPDVGGIAGDRLRSFIERIERLEEERRTLAVDIKEVFAEAKGSGFDTKIMRQLIKERRMDKDDLDEQQALLDVYRQALGMLPLFEAAERAEAETPRSIRVSAEQFGKVAAAIDQSGVLDSKRSRRKAAAKRLKEAGVSNVTVSGSSALNDEIAERLEEAGIPVVRSEASSLDQAPT